MRHRIVALEEANRALESQLAERVLEVERLGRVGRALSPRLAQLLGSAEGEALLETHRARVAVLGCQMGGFTALSETAAPEEALAVLDDYHRLVDAAIDRFGGTLGSLDGDRLTVLFNDPLPVDDPAGRAAATALDLRERLREPLASWRRRGYELEAGFGVAIGHATLGLVRVGGRSEYVAMGPVVDVAARLAAEAKGRVLATGWVCAAVEGRIAGAPLGELRLDGLVRSVAAFELGPAAREVRGGEERVTARGPLTDREWEVVELIVRGRTNREIGRELVIAEGTAVRHVANILNKLDLRSRAEVAVWAVRRGQTPASPS